MGATPRSSRRSIEELQALTANVIVYGIGIVAPGGCPLIGLALCVLPVAAGVLVCALTPSCFQVALEFADIIRELGSDVWDGVMWTWERLQDVLAEWPIEPGLEVLERMSNGECLLGALGLVPCADFGDLIDFAMRFATLDCLGFAFDVVGMFTMGGAAFYLVSASAFALSFAIDMSQEDYVGGGGDVMAILVEPFALDEFAKYNPAIAGNAKFLAGIPTAWSGLQCAMSAYEG